MKKILLLTLLFFPFLLDGKIKIYQNRYENYDWRYLTRTFWYDIYYDYKTLGMIDNSMLLYLKYVPLPSEFETVVELRKYSVEDNPELYEKYDNFAYSIQLHLWDCQNKLNAIMLFEDYDIKNQIIQAQYCPLDSLVWFDVSGDMYGEQMIKEVCKLRGVFKSKSKSKK